MSKIKRIAKIFFGLPLTVIAFLFIAKIIFDSWPSIEKLLETANLLLLLVGFFWMLIFFLLHSLVWRKILEVFGKSDKSAAESIYHYSLAETKRYIPGNIFSLVSRVQKFKGNTYSSRVLIQGIVIETTMVLLSSFIVSIPALFNVVQRKNLGNYTLLFFVFAVLLTVFFVFVLKNRLRKIYESKLKFFFGRRSFSSYLDTFSISIASWMCFALGNYFFMSSLYPTDPGKILLYSSMFAAAWLIGYVSFVAPMGLGVREAATIYLFAPVVPLYVATALAVFTRIFLISSELVFLALAYFVNKFRKDIKRFFPMPPSFLAVSLFAFIYTVYFTFFTILRHANFFSGRFDLGNMEQTVWNTINERFFLLTNPDGLGEVSRLSFHADFILILLSPFYYFYQNANFLLISQTLLIALGGYFVYFIAKDVVKSDRIAAVLGIGYYFNYFVQEQNIFDFHPVSLATSFLLIAFYFLIKKKYLFFALSLFLAILTKENVYLVASVFGLYLYASGKKAFGAAVFFVSLITFTVLLAVVIPETRGDSHFALSYLSYLGDSTIEILLSPILAPKDFFGQLFSINTFNYFYQVFLPAGFLSIFSPFYLLFLVPDFLINIMSSNSNLRSIQYHYGALIVPFIYISAIFGIKSIISKFKNKDLIKGIIFYYLILVIVASSFKYSPLPGSKNSDLTAFLKIENRNEIDNYLKGLSENLSIAATNNVAAHLSKRREIYVLPNGIGTAEYLVFYKEKLDIAETIKADGKYVIVEKIGEDFVVFKKN